MALLEKTFNSKFGYPWVFLNEEPFSEAFINYTTSMTTSKTYYGLVNESMWGYPDFIDQEKAANERERLKKLPYGLSESYRHMCRFQRYIDKGFLFCFVFLYKYITDIDYIRIVAFFGDIHLF
jgi:alpha 1,2-mannosyltransferase